MADPIEKALKHLQQAARDNSKPPPDPRAHMTFFVSPEEGEEDLWIALYDEGVWAFEDTRDLLAGDQRFEHLDKNTREEALRAFVATAAIHRGGSHIKQFVEKHAHEEIDMVCLFTLEHLTVTERAVRFGAIFIPPDEAEMPGLMGPQLTPVTGIVAVPCAGTDARAILRRAREDAELALRLLRVALSLRISPDQLRFRLGTNYWFTREDEDGGRYPGWKRRDDEPFRLTLSDERFDPEAIAALSTLPLRGGTDIEKRARRAASWFERALLETDQTVGVLFLFIALETLVGDSDAGLKARKLALRRALLSESLDLGFADPYRAFILYDEVRSNAVHGEEAPEVDRSVYQGLLADFRSAISEYLRYATQHGLSRRSALTRRLDADPRRGDIEAFLGPADDGDAPHDESS